MTKDRYLFRGFHKEENGKETIYIDGQVIKGEWVYGYYIASSTKYVIMPHFTEKYEVIPETIGQCCGLSDKNGRLIFEKDIIYDKYDYFEVYFEDGSFLARWLYADLEGYKEISYLDAINNDCEVIKTIFDKEVNDNE